MSTRAQVYLLALLFILLGASLVLYKSIVLGFPIFPGQYKTVWTIEAKVEFEALGDPVKVSLALPRSQPNMEILDETFSSSGYGFSFDDYDGSQRAVWSKRKANGKESLFYKLETYRSNVWLDDANQFLPADDLQKPVLGTQNLAAKEQALTSILQEVKERSADPVTFTAQLISELNDENNQDSNMLFEYYSGPKRSKIARDILALADIPSHYVRGIYLEDDRSNIGPTQLIEIFDGTQWVAFDVKTGTRGLPENFFMWQRGGPSLLDIEGAKNSRVRFSVLANDVPSRSIALSQGHDEALTLVDFSIFSLPIEQQSIMKFILLIPVGALVVVLMRVLIGLRTAGTFMPVLLAIAFIQTTLVTGVAIFLLITFVGLWVRTYLSRLNLLLVARLTAVVLIVVVLMATISVVSYKLRIEQALTVTFFPMVILAWTIERMSILWEEDGAKEAIIQLFGSLIVAIVAYLVMTVPLVEHWMFNFPEVLFVELGIILILGSYTGYRLSESLRFRFLGAD